MYRHLESTEFVRLLGILISCFFNAAELKSTSGIVQECLKHGFVFILMANSLLAVLTKILIDLTIGFPAIEHTFYSS